MKFMRRLAFFLPSLAGGGAERVMLNLAQGFAERGYAVDLVLATKTGPYLGDVPDSVRLVGLDRSRVSLSVPKLISYLSAERPEVVISAMTHCNVAAIAASLLSRGSIPVIGTEHVALLESQIHMDRRVEWLLQPLARILYPRARCIIAVSYGVANQLYASLKLEKEKLAVVYNPVVGESLLQSSNERLDDPWFEASAPPVVLAVGRLSTQKDFGTLVRAFSLVRRRRQARLLILGEGEKRDELQRLVDALSLSTDTQLMGFVRNPYKYMKNAKVFVLSSRYEGLGNVIIEAMACGTPIVSTDCPSGPAEILENGRWGRLVPVGDAEAMASAIEAVLDEAVHPDVTTRADDFTIQKSVDGYARVIERALRSAA